MDDQAVSAEFVNQFIYFVQRIFLDQLFHLRDAEVGIQGQIVAYHGPHIKIVEAEVVVQQRTTGA